MYGVRLTVNKYQEDTCAWNVCYGYILSVEAYEINGVSTVACKDNRERSCTSLWYRLVKPNDNYSSERLPNCRVIVEVERYLRCANCDAVA